MHATDELIKSRKIGGLIMQEFNRQVTLQVPKASFLLLVFLFFCLFVFLLFFVFVFFFQNKERGSHFDKIVIVWHTHDLAGTKHRTQVTGHRSQGIVLLVLKVSQTLVKAKVRPINFCLGLFKPQVSFYKCLGYFLYWENNDLWPVFCTCNSWSSKL